MTTAYIIYTHTHTNLKCGRICMFPVIGGFLLLLCLSDVLCNLLQQLFSLRRQATDSVNLYVKDNII